MGNCFRMAGWKMERIERRCTGRSRHPGNGTRGIVGGCSHITGMDSLPPDSITRMYHEKATRTVMDRSFPVRIRNDPAVLRVLGSSHRAD